MTSQLVNPDDTPEYDPEAFFEGVRRYRDIIEKSLSDGVKATIHIVRNDDSRCMATLVYEKDGHEGYYLTGFVMKRKKDNSAETSTIVSMRHDVVWNLAKTADLEKD